MEGHTAAVEAGEAWAIQYVIALGAGWLTRGARVTSRSAVGSRELVYDEFGLLLDYPGIATRAA